MSCRNGWCLQTHPCFCFTSLLTIKLRQAGGGGWWAFCLGARMPLPTCPIPVSVPSREGRSHGPQKQHLPSPCPSVFPQDIFPNMCGAAFLHAFCHLACCFLSSSKLVGIISKISNTCPSGKRTLDGSWLPKSTLPSAFSLSLSNYLSQAITPTQKAGWRWRQTCDIHALAAL